MQLYQIIAVSVLGLILLVTRTQADDHCEANDDKISACVGIFVGLNDDAKNSTACLKDELKGSCISYKAMKFCVDVGKDASKNEKCKTKISAQLKAKGIDCTFDEVVAAVQCAGSAVTFNLALFVGTALLAVFKF